MLLIIVLRVSLRMISRSLLDFSLCMYFPLFYSDLHMGMSLRDSQTSFWFFWVAFRPFGFRFMTISLLTGNHIGCFSLQLLPSPPKAKTP